MEGTADRERQLAEAIMMRMAGFRALGVANL
jgi:hypothetical protein